MILIGLAAALVIPGMIPGRTNDGMLPLASLDGRPS
jgi:hypothetical protein